MRQRSIVTWLARVLAGSLLVHAGSVTAETYFLPSSAWSAGANGAKYRTDVWLMNPGTAFVTVTAMFFDQVNYGTRQSPEIRIDGRTQAAFESVHDSMFSWPVPFGAYGPMRFDSTGPLVIAASVTNVNACGKEAVSGQWLPALEASEALLRGVIGQLAVSALPSSGYRTNLVVMNPGFRPATATVRVRSGGGAILATGTVGPLSGGSYGGGFAQVALDGFAGMAGRTETNLWVEFTSDQPVFAYGTVIHNVSGDPFAVMASPDVPPPGPNEISFLLPGDVPLVMVRIPAGTFQMGSPPTERRPLNQKELLHTVRLTSDYFVGKYEVTQRQWRAVMGSNPSDFEDCPGDCPVDSVSWEDVRRPGGFLAKLNELLGTTKFRLPTEAEWERAARGGNQMRFSFGDALDGLDKGCSANAAAIPYVWWCGSGAYRPLPVGTKLPNPYGLFDVHGNLWEWVEDWFGSYTAAEQTDPTGPTKGTDRALRGGGYYYDLIDLRSASRRPYPPNFAPPIIGFRLAMSP